MRKLRKRTASYSNIMLSSNGLINSNRGRPMAMQGYWPLGWPAIVLFLLLTWDVTASFYGRANLVFFLHKWLSCFVVQKIVYLTINQS